MIRHRRGQWQLDSGPVPHGRWHYLSYGVDVGAFWSDAMRLWNRARLAERAGQAMLNAEMRR
jgi:hypothetical protein